MQRELRLQEDRIYQLEGYIEQYQAMLEAQEGAPELLRAPTADPLPSETNKLPSIRRGNTAPRDSTPKSPPGGLAPPDIDLGEPDSTAPSLRKPVTEDLLPEDPLPSLPDFDAARSPAWGRRRLSDRPLFKSAVRPLERLRERVEASPIWQPNRPATETDAPNGGSEAPKWEGNRAEPQVESTRTAEAPPAESSAPTVRLPTPLKQATRPEWRPYR
jgi:hypothetical protein